MSSSNSITVPAKDLQPKPETAELDRENFEKFNLKAVADSIWSAINQLDQTIQREAPFKLIKTEPAKAQKIIQELLVNLFDIALRLAPFLPETSQTIQTLILSNKMPDKPLFARRD